ncbi:MAG: permease component of ABC-type sugar transporter [Acidimicrobiales bacterium]|jgi:ABC-type sugar transport system permease subunit|nr:permease component of ABC-type sugar transporter [Acidimicrobiales bacterium]
MAVPSVAADTPAAAEAPAVLGTSGAREERVAGRRREWPLALLFLAPSAAVFAVFVFYPLYRTIQLSMYRSGPFGRLGEFEGLSNLTDVLGSDEFRHSLGVTFQFSAITVPLGLALGLGLAVLAHERLRGISVYRTIFASTVATSVAVASIMWLLLLNPSVGVVNAFLEWLGQDRIDFINEPGWALWTVSITTVWLNLGFSFIVISAGLQSVPDDLLESARMDGAGAWRRFRHVTLPMLSPTLLFVLVVLSINAFQSFGQIDLLTEGGPNDRTRVLVYAIFQEVRRGDPSTAAAQAVALFGILFLLTIVQLRVLERRVFYG